MSFSYLKFNQSNFIENNNDALSMVTNANINIVSSNYAIDMLGDVMMTCNLVVNKTAYAKDLVISRHFEDNGGFAIAYGFRINDDGRLEIYKHDSRLDKSVTVNKMGIGNVQMGNDAIIENSTPLYDDILKKSLYLNLYNSNIF
jgi:hypothetical protein